MGLRRARCVAALLLCCSCGGSNGGGTQTFIEIENDSASIIEVVRYSTCASAAFAEDVLDGAVGPRQSFTFEVDGGGCYDVFVGLEDTDGNEREVTFTSVEVSDGATHTLTVTNP